MKKSLILVGMLSIGYAYAQEGRVGINTENPKATLEIQPNATNIAATATTNEGLLIPRLGKSRVALMTTPEKSTLVYVNDTAYTPENTSTPTAKDQRVAEINTEGFYHYNGTKWVKHIDGNETNLLWEKEVTTNNIKLIDAVSANNLVFYNPNGGLNIIPRTMRTFSYMNGTNIDNATIQFSGINENTGLRIAYADKLHKPSKGYRSMLHNYLLMDNNNIATHSETYVLQNNEFHEAESSNQTYANLFGARNMVEKYGKGTISWSMAGAYNRANIRNGKAKHVMGAYNEGFASSHFTEIENLYGAHNVVSMHEGSATGVIKTAAASHNVASLYGYARFTVENLIGSLNDASMLAGYEGKINRLTGVVVDYAEVAQSIDKIDENYGVRVSNITKGKNKNYGLFIEDVGRSGATDNYAIHTGAGKIRVGDLAGAGSRPVFATADGVLTTGNTSAIQVGNTDNITCTSANAGTMNYKEVERNGQQIGVFGFCIRRGSDYVWAYMAGGSNIFGTSANGAAFGDGL